MHKHTPRQSQPWSRPSLLPWARFSSHPSSSTLLLVVVLVLVLVLVVVGLVPLVSLIAHTQKDILPR